MANNYYESFVQKLKEIFMMDHAELDFGIYRIMNQKREEITKFLEHELLPQVKEALAADSAETEAMKKRMAEITAQLGTDINSLPETIPMMKEYKELQAKLTSSADADELQAEVFSHLVTFFSRYYDGGDFISKRRYKDNAYAIPYNGEEVKLHWANADQYYIKTSEYFRNYTFTLPESKKKVHFVLKDASTEQNNNQNINNMERRFSLYEAQTEEESIVEVDENGELHIYFTYELMPKSVKQDDLMAKAFDEIKGQIPQDFEELLTVKIPTDKLPNRTLLEKHLNDYKSKNSFDYFIHKDLGDFLSRELDFYIKNEVLHIDDLEAKYINKQLTIVRAIKQVGQKIIRMLAQLENFQKRLWLKKKFVVQCDYCITLDRVPEALYPEIIDNEAQRKEWVRLFAIDEIQGDLTSKGYSEPLTEEFLKQNPFLVLDTTFFSADFKHSLLKSMDNIDEQINGMLINSENFQALELLQEKYKKQIICAHIDPPYNTKTSGFLYKNNYQHSSWISMMYERVNVAKKMLQEDGSLVVHIDENEYANLWEMLNTTGLYAIGTVIWDKRNPMTGGGGIANQHEYITWHSPSMIKVTTDGGNTSLILEKAKSLIQQFPGNIEKVRQEFSKWINSTDCLSGGEKAYHYIDDNGYVYSSVSLRAPEPRTDPKFFQPLIHPITKKPCPVPPNGFSRTPETLSMMMSKGEILFGKDESTQPRQKRILTLDQETQLNSVITNAVKGTTDLKEMKLTFPYCHAVSFYSTIILAGSKKNDSIVLDFFAGSGTTGHAVINLNREDGGNRKYMLVEMGEYFDTVTKPRIEKVIYSEDWDKGKPVSRKGVSQCFKYMRLEQYEDTLNNLAVKHDDTIKFEDNSKFKESYMLDYMLDVETRDSLLNMKLFENPFAVTLKTTKDNELIETSIDLVETFNYLIGLNVETIDWYNEDNICVVQGRTRRDNLKTLVIWRNIKEVGNETLDRFFEKMDFRTRDTEFDVIYVNGDNTLPNLRRDEEHWKVVLTEEEFAKRMFEED